MSDRLPWVLVADKRHREKKTNRNSFDLIDSIHKSQLENTIPEINPDHAFEVTLEHDTFTEEKYKLFENYQRNVHKESQADISKGGFRRFLCSSPLVRTELPIDGSTPRLGSYHQCYRLDDRLIAMAVLDFLPHGVSAVYFMYHQEFEKWSFGKLSALQEAALVMEGNYQFYYMGYYIHSCIKMRYKGDYKQQYILDPETYDWNVLDDKIKDKLSQTKYLSPSAEAKIVQQNTKTPPTQEQQPTISSDVESGLETGADVADAGPTTFDSGMPGVMSAEELENDVELGDVLLMLTKGQRRIVPTSVCLPGTQERRVRAHD